MTAKMLFFVMHFIGVGITVLGYFFSPLIGIGVFFITVNAVMMGFYCHIIFK